MSLTMLGNSSACAVQRGTRDAQTRVSRPTAGVRLGPLGATWKKSSVSRAAAVRRTRRACCSDDSGSTEPSYGKTLSNLDALLGPKEEPAARVPDAPPAPRPNASDSSSKSVDTENSNGSGNSSGNLLGGLGSSSKPQGQGQREPEKGNGAPLADRVVASVCYVLPLLDGLRYSKFLLQQFPQFGLLLLPLAPVYSLYQSLGFFSNLLFFFGMYVGVAKNNNMSGFVRFNGAQAIVLDILMILPDVLVGGFGGVGKGLGSAGNEIEVLFFNTTFLFLYACSTYGTVTCLATGKKPLLPLVADAAKMQSMTFMDDEDDD